MVWFKVDDNLAFHHKVIAAGNPAMGLWVRAGSACAQQLTDGFVHDHMIAALGTVAQAKRLVLVGLWTREEGGYSFNGWEERQPSKQNVEAERAAAADRMREFRAKKKGTTQKASPQVSDIGSGNVQANERRTNGEVQEMFGNPDPTRPDPTHISTTDVPEGHDQERPEVIALCDRLAKAIEANGVPKPNIGKTWHDAARLLIDKDGYTVQQIEWMIDWASNDEFWRTNILSMPKLRHQFPQLKLKSGVAVGTKPKHDPDWALR